MRGSDEPLAELSLFGIGVGDGGEEGLGSLDGVGLVGGIVGRVLLEEVDDSLVEGGHCV